MKISLFSPLEVEAALGQIIIADDASAHANDQKESWEGDNDPHTQANGNKGNCNTDTSTHDIEYELEIDFDPPAPRTRINSPEDLLTMRPSERPTRSYNIEAVHLAQLLEYSHLFFGGERMTRLTLNKVFLLPMLVAGGGPGHDLEAMDVFWNAFGHVSCQNLKHVVAKDCMIHPDRWMERGLSQLPLLETVRLDNVMAVETRLRPEEEPENFDEDLGVTSMSHISLTMPAVATLLRQRVGTLVELDLVGLRVPVEMETMRNTCQAVIECTTLRRLSCPRFHPTSDLTKEHNELFGRMIAQAHPSLRDLAVVVLGIVSLDPIAQGLAQNTGLQYLTIHGAHKMFLVDHHPCSELVAFRDALAENVTLRGLAMLHDGDGIMPGTRTWDDLVLNRFYAEYSFAVKRYLWSGYRHRDINQDVEDDVNRLAIRQLQFYLHLNQLGRGRFLHSRPLATADIHSDRHTLTRDDYLDIVFTNRDDISVSFYFFQLNPSLYFV